MVAGFGGIEGVFFLFERAFANRHALVGIVQQPTKVANS